MKNLLFLTALTLTPTTGFCVGIINSIDATLDFISKWDEPEYGYAGYYTRQNNFETKNIYSWSISDDSDLDADDDSDLDADDDSDSDIDDDSDTDDVEYIEVVRKNTKLKKNNNFWFKTKLHPRSPVNGPSLIQDNVSFGDFPHSAPARKSLENLMNNLDTFFQNKKQLGCMNFGKFQAKFFAKSKADLSEFVKQEFVKQSDGKYAAKDLEVYCWSSYIRKSEGKKGNAQAASWPHIDVNTQSLQTLRNSTMTIAEFAVDAQNLDNVKSIFDKREIVSMLNLWTPLQRDPVGYPLAFNTKVSTSRLSYQPARETVFTPKIQTLIDDSLEGEEIDSMSRIVDSNTIEDLSDTWIYRKNMTFGKYYLFDTMRSMHSAFLMGGPGSEQSDRISVEYRFIVFKK